MLRWIGGGLVLVGLVLAGNMAWTAWGTGISTDRAQAEFHDQWQQQLEERSMETEEREGEVYVYEPDDPEVSSSEDFPAEDTAAETAPAPTLAPTEKTTSDTFLDDVVMKLRHLPAAGPSMSMTPSRGLYVLKDVEELTLRAGPGHYPGTNLPGEGGVVGLAGHRTTYGAPFSDLDDVKVGDEFVVRTAAGKFIYRVHSGGAPLVVEAHETWVLDSQSDREELVLTTCHPKWSDSRRLVVRAEKVNSWYANF